ncbi:MAG: sigma factor-like helix-turn-helix DNA-binding protein [Lachnospiraceae bacterium]
MITVNLKDFYYWCKEDIFIEITEEMLTAALNNTLNEIQQRRLKLYYFDGMRYSQIARMKGVTDGSISGSIKSALRRRSPSESPRDTLPRSGKCQSGSYTSLKYMTVAVA